MTKQRECKQVMRGFMRQHYSDEQLAMALAHARDGKMAYQSCCCFVGLLTADHALQPQIEHYLQEHYIVASRLFNSGSITPMDAFYYIGDGDNENWGSEPKRRRILIPMIRAEMKRREKLRAEEKCQSNTATAGKMSTTPSLKDLAETSFKTSYSR